MALIPGKKQNAEDKKAQQQAAQDEVLMREIDEAVRQDEFAAIARNYGRPLLALLVAGILGFGGYLFWQSRQEAALEKQSEELVTALDRLEAGNLQGAADLAAKMGDGGAAAKTSALFLQAAVALEQGKTAEAAAFFKQVSDDERAPPALRDLATIREVSARYDAMKPDEVIARLKPLAVPGNPWFGSAGELLAMAYLDKGDKKQAGTLLGEIAKNEDVPETLRSRTRQMAGLLGVDAIGDADEFLEEQEITDEASAVSASN